MCVCVCARQCVCVCVCRVFWKRKVLERSSGRIPAPDCPPVHYGTRRKKRRKECAGRRRRRRIRKGRGEVQGVTGGWLHGSAFSTLLSLSLSCFFFSVFSYSAERLRQTRRVCSRFKAEKKEGKFSSIFVRVFFFSPFFLLLLLHHQARIFGCLTNRCCLSFARSAGKQLVVCRGLTTLRAYRSLLFILIRPVTRAR